MFYSHTILARKGPLGTVWCAAHLQHRLKKSHYAATDIPSTVDRIMFPEVPIALRMSGHLLLGVVRIYSKKVDYLYQDCNVTLNGLRKAFASIDLNLPENTMQALPQSITLPETFYLDDLDLGADFDIEGDHDDHLRNQEDITLTEQIPNEINPYVAITFDEDIQMEDLTHRTEDFGSYVSPMVLDTIHPHLDPGTHSPVNVMDDQTLHTDKVNLQGSQGTTGMPSMTDEQLRPSDDFTLPVSLETKAQINIDAQDPGPSRSTETISLHDKDQSPPESVPEIEVQRNAVSDISSETFPLSSSHINEGTDPQDQHSNEKVILSPIKEGSLHSGGLSLSLRPTSGTPASVASLSEGRQNDNISVSMAIRSTPPVDQPPIVRPRPKKRKKQYFDDPVVLSNKYIGKMLKDASDLKRTRKNIPSSALGVSKLNNSIRKEQVFLQPLLSALCSDLCNIHDETYISTQSHLFEDALPDSRLPRSPSSATNISEPGAAQSVPVDEASPENKGPESPSSPATRCDQEIEQLRDTEQDGAHIISDFAPSLRNTHFPMINDRTPVPLEKMWSASVPPLGTSTGTQILQTPDLPTSTGYSESDFGTPRTPLEKRLRPEYTGPSHNQESVTAEAEAEDLWFLEADDRTPSDSQGAEGVDSLSVRTRAVANYLKSRSPEDLSSDLSLNNILEGKRRKLCARMFFETLVLKSFGLIDVKQQVPYGDISLKLTQALAKAQI